MSKFEVKLDFRLLAENPQIVLVVPSLEDNGCAASFLDIWPARLLRVAAETTVGWARRGPAMAITGEFLSAIFGTPSEINVLEHLTKLNQRHLGARYGSAQLYDPELQQLQLVVNCGFKHRLLDQFDTTSLSGKSACARAAAMKAPVVAANIPTNPDWDSIRTFSLEAGFSGVLSYPIISRTGDLLGVTSVHFDDRAPLTTTELELVRVSCDFAADAIAELRFSERPRKSAWNARDSLT